MFEFVNDPQFDGLPLVGEGHAAVAVRTHCGRAARWLPGGDVMALAKFLGETYVVVGETLYSHEGTGVLSPVYLSRPMVVFVPPAGEPWTTWDIAGFPATYAQVVGPPVDDARPRIAERDAMIAALKAEVAEAQVQAAKLVEMYGSPHAAPAKPAGATKKAAAVKEKSDGDKSGA